MMNTLDQAYRQAKETAEWAMGYVQGLEISATTKNRLAGAAYGLALEHQRGMTVLIEAKAYGSTLALLRSAVEGFALGYWLLYQTDEAQLTAFVEGKSKPSLDFLLRCIADEHSSGPRKGQLQQLVKRLNAFTHGGIEHLVMRQGHGVVGPRYDVEDMANALGIGAWIAKMAAVDIVGGVASNAELADEMLRGVEEVLPFHPSPDLSPTA